jgi:hypothetical protein
MEAWKNDPMNKKVSKAGDDRSPAFRWIGSLYHDGTNIAIPSDLIMACLMGGGAMVPVPGGRGGKTFKAQTQSGCITGEAFWPMQIRGQLVNMRALECLMQEGDFAEHQRVVTALGFDLFVKRAAIGPAKHVRVRPRFAQWIATGTLNVWDEQLTTEIVQTIFNYAGQYKGLGDWRPGSKRPGPHGMFAAQVLEL